MTVLPNSVKRRHLSELSKFSQKLPVVKLIFVLNNPFNEPVGGVQGRLDFLYFVLHFKIAAYLFEDSFKRT